MNIKQKFIIAITTILIISFTLVGVTYSYFISKSHNKPIKEIDNDLYVHYQDNNDLITINNITDSAVIYKYIKLNSKNKINYSIGLITSYDTTPFRDGITQDEVNINTNLVVEDPDGYYDNIYVTLVSSNNIDEKNLENSFNEGNTVYKEKNLIKDNKEILDKSSINDEKYYILKIEYKNDPLLPVNSLSNVNILINIYDTSIIRK